MNTEKSKRMSMRDRAAADIAAIPEPTDEEIAQDQKRLTAGSLRRLQESIDRLPIKRQEEIGIEHIHFRHGLERDASEFEGAEWDSFVDSIRQTKGNQTPVDVRPRLAGGYELLAGERRWRACRACGFKSVFASIRECDDRTADRLHEIENTQRKNKAPYSRGLQYSTMMASGMYESEVDLATSLGTGRARLNEYLRFYRRAPEGMWALISRPGLLKSTAMPVILAAYDKPHLLMQRLTEEAAKGEDGKVSPERFVAIAREVNRPSIRKPMPDSVRVVKRAGGFHVVLPKAVSEKKAGEIAAAVVRMLKE